MGKELYSLVCLFFEQWFWLLIIMARGARWEIREALGHEELWHLCPLSVAFGETDCFYEEPEGRNSDVEMES